MRGRSVFKFLILLGCASVCTSGGLKGKKVLFKFHVPELIKHQHHTNVVFLHKHHDHHGDHDNHHRKHPRHHHHHHHHDDDGKHAQKHHDLEGKALGDYHSHSYGGHYSHNYGEPPGFHHSHSFDHQHQYSFNDGHGDGHHFSGGEGHEKPKKKNNFKKKSRKKPVKKERKHKSNHGNQKFRDGKTENYYDFGINFNHPNTETQHYHYATYTPTYSLDNNNNLREANESIRHEILKIQTTGNSFPDTQGFRGSSEIQTKGNYEVDEPSYDYDTEYHNNKPASGAFKGDSEYYYNADAEQNKGLGSYAEDFTNPYSVAKYTSAIKHGALNLEDSSYNPEHGNDLEEYIREFQRSDEI